MIINKVINITGIVFGEQDAPYYDIISRLHTWFSCTACILASRGGCSCARDIFCADVTSTD